MKLPATLMQAVTLGLSAMICGCNSETESFIQANSQNTLLRFMEKNDSPAVDTLTVPLTGEDSLELRLNQMYPKGAKTSKGRKHYYCPTCGMG